MISCLPAPPRGNKAGRRSGQVWALAVAALALVAATPARATGDLYGLVIGANDYQAPIPALDGAINDVEDVAAALRQNQARRVWLLKDREATRDRIFAAWHELTSQARPGDSVVVHLAGHGARSAEKVRGTGADGLDEFFVLPGFGAEGPATRERVINKEWGGLLRQAPQLKILFIADTCYSGSMTRGYAPRRLHTRVAAPQPIELRDDALPAPDPAQWVVTPDQLSHVVFFGAVGRDELDPEVLIDQRPRGALSWAVANGLRGAADFDHDGVVTKDELARYVSDVVVTQTEGEQHPRIVSGKIDLSLPVAGQKARTDPPPQSPPLSLEILAVSPEQARALADRLHGITLAPPRTPADLTWDVARGELRNGFQDVLVFAGAPTQPSAETTRDYHRVSPAGGTPGAGVTAPAAGGEPSLSRIQAAIDKEALANWLVALTDRQPLGLRLAPRDGVQHGGDHATLSIGDTAPPPHLVVVNLGPTGNVNLIYPVAGDPPTLPSGQPYRLDLTASPPFGAEHFVAFASVRPLDALRQGVAAIDGQPRLDVLRRLVREAWERGGLQVGVHPVFTVP